MTYRHNETNEQFLSLHDCRADRVELHEGVLSFFFPDGIRIGPNHSDNPTGETVRTDVACVDFPLLTGEMDDLCIFVFRDISRFLTIRQEWSVEKLMQELGTKKCELEFISVYDGYMERLYTCCLWQEKKPYHRDCQLLITTKQPVYRWNTLRPEQEW